MGFIKHVVVIGAGVAGIETALMLSKLGYEVTVVEKADKVGGKLNRWSLLFPDFANAADVVAQLQASIASQVIKIIYNTEIVSVEKQNNRFEISDSGNVKLYADAVVMASGYKLFDATIKEEYGYGIFDNVITSADFEFLCKHKKQLTTSSGEIPKRVAIIHCVGSRDAKVGNTYCSKVCCVTGVKQAIEINKMYPHTEVFCFYMDLRLYGSKFDSLYLSAQKQHNIQFIRGRLSEVSERIDGSLQIKAEDTLAGRPLRMNVDMVLLLVGMESNNCVENNQIKTDENGFYKSTDMHLARNCSTQRGVFLSGACICPMSVNEVVENARAAAFHVHEYLTTVAV